MAVLLAVLAAAAIAGCGSGSGEIPIPDEPIAAPGGFVSPGDSAEDETVNSSTRAAGGQAAERAHDRR